MSVRDYANRRRSRKNSSKTDRTSRHSHYRTKTFSPMFWLVAVLGGVFAASIAYIELVQKNPSYSKSKLIAKKQELVEVHKPKNKAKVDTEKDRKLPRFEFYHTLPKMEVAVSKEHNQSLSNNQVVKKESMPADNLQNYSLQIASFKDYKDAEALKVKLLLAGFDVIIQSVTLENKDVWHRVKTSKFTDLASAKHTSDELQKHHIKSLMVVERG